jgi:predicted phosphohydrolase
MIFITGDMHSGHDIGKFTTDNFSLGRVLTKDDYIIIVGDFGLFFQNPQTPSDKYYLDWLNEKPWTTLFLRGNHDNPHMLEALPIAEKFGGKMGIAADSVFFLRDGEIYTIEDKTFFVYGGAMSTDIKYRTKDEDWWAEEIPSIEIQDYALSNLQKHNHQVDCILTHTAPHTVILEHIVPMMPEYLKRAEDPVAIFLSSVMAIVEFDQWFFGHFHTNATFGKNGNFHLLYNNFLEIQ